VKVNKKVFVRERIALLLDSDTEFWELGTTVGLGLEYGDVPCGGTVCGVGTINGTQVMIMANDGTVKGGTFYPITITKQLRIQEIAAQNRLPTLQIVDTGGAFLPLQADIFLRGGRGFANQAIMSSQGIQQVALVSGLCTAGGAYAPTMSDVAIITHKIGNIYLGGPPLVKAATGEVITGEELGGATMHCSVSGITDHFAQDEAESFQITRDVIASLNLPDSGGDLEDTDPPLYSAQQFLQLAGANFLDKPSVYSVIARIVDGSRFLEFKKLFGGNLICGFSHLMGNTVGILANSGPITGPDAQKGGHFVQLCDNRDIPIIFLQNSSSSEDNSMSSDATVLKERAKFIQCLSVVRVPKVTLNLTGAYGDENFTMCGPSFQPRFYLMWPGARIHPSEPAIPAAHNAVNKAALEAAEAAAVVGTQEVAPAKKARKPLSKFCFEPGSAQWAASRGICDEIVSPVETRRMLARALQISMLNHVPLRDTRGQHRAVIRM
jgi:3-methylcrotonyl-CoA carboxylase beta subunit